jgi:hypothetical protein
VQNQHLHDLAHLTPLYSALTKNRGRGRQGTSDPTNRISKTELNRDFAYSSRSPLLRHFLASPSASPQISLRGTRSVHSGRVGQLGNSLSEVFPMY